MARLLVKRTLLAHEGRLYGRGEAVEMDDTLAARLASAYPDRFALAGQSDARAAATNAKKKTPAKTGAPKVKEESVSLPEADAAAAVRK